MINHSDLSETYWAEAVRSAVYIGNSTTTSILIDKTPFEVWYGHKPTVGHLKTFGSKAIVLEKTSSKKFRSKGVESLMVGYSDE